MALLYGIKASLAGNLDSWSDHVIDHALCAPHFHAIESDTNRLNAFIEDGWSVSSVDLQGHKNTKGMPILGRRGGGVYQKYDG